LISITDEAGHATHLSHDERDLLWTVEAPEDRDIAYAG